VTIFELSRPVVASAFRNERPFVYSVAPGDWETADYWTSAFGAPKESASESMHIGSFFRDGVNRYAPMTSLLAVLAQERSFWWGVESSIVSYAGVPVTYAGVVVTDGVSKQARLYVHLEHDQHILGPVYQYGKTQGYCKEQALYIDDIFYSPVLESIPSLSQEQDLEAYDALAFISGAAVFKNANGDMDWMIDQPPFGFECAIARLALERGVRDYTRADLTYLAALYVEDFSASLSKTTLNLQDRRKAQNIKVPTELLSAVDYANLEDNLVDKPVPLLYGTVAALEPILLNGEAESGAVEYLIAPRLVSMGTVQVKKTINEVDTWVTVTPATVDLTTGIFTLSAADGRDDKTPYDCRVLNPNLLIPTINETLNPVIAGAQETSRVMIGDTCHVFYSAGGGALYHAIATDALCRTLSGAAATNITACRFPAVFYFEGYFYCATHIVDQGPLYMYASTDGVTWGILNAGNPVMSAGAGIYAHFWNPCIAMDEDGDTMHFVIEAGVAADQSDVGLGYSHGSLAELLASDVSGTFSFESNLSAELIIPGGGNPFIQAIPERDAILILAGNINVIDEWWRIRAHYASTAADLSLAASWTMSPYFKVEYEGMHTADPDLIALPASKTYGLLMGYMYNQSSSYQLYFDMTLLELYDAIVAGNRMLPVDVIKDLNTRYLGSQYLEGEYDLTEWVAAEAALDNIGLYIAEQTELYELIRKLQGGSVAGFRYEYRPDGRRTARIDDWDRAPAYRIAREDIADIEDVEVETDSDLLAASIKVRYAHDYAQDNDSEKIDVSKKTAVQLAYRQEPQLEFESLLQTESLAAECAALKADRYSVARMIASLEVLGAEFLALRIYDVVIVELVPRGYDADSGALLGSRRWVGVWKAIVLSIDPDISEETNKVSLALIANITDVVPVLVTETSYLDAGDGTPLILG